MDRQSLDSVARSPRSSWGGKRPQAGRKPLPDRSAVLAVPYSVRIPSELLERAARQHKIKKVNHALVASLVQKGLEYAHKSIDYDFRQPGRVFTLRVSEATAAAIQKARQPDESTYQALRRLFYLGLTGGEDKTH